MENCFPTQLAEILLGEKYIRRLSYDFQRSPPHRISQARLINRQLSYLGHASRDEGEESVGATERHHISGLT